MSWLPVTTPDLGHAVADEIQRRLVIVPPEPSLRSGRVQLRLWRPSDVDMLVGASEDEQIRRGSSLRVEDMPASAVGWLTKRETMRRDGSGLSMAIEEMSRPGVSVGCVALNKLELAHLRRAFVGCWFIPGARGRGLGPAAVALLCNWGLDVLALDEIIALVEPANRTSWVMLESLGFTYYGIEPAAHRIEGVPYDMAVFRRRSDEGLLRQPYRCVAVVLAAGRGTRMDGATPKPLRLVGGRTMLDRVIETAVAVTGRPGVVVAPANGSLVAEQAQRHGWEVVTQQAPAGTAHALLRGLEVSGVDEQTDAVLVLNADVPLLRADSLRRLVDVCARPGDGLGGVLSFTPGSSRGYGRLVTAPDGRMTSLAEPAFPYEPAESATGAYCFGSPGLRARLRSIPASPGGEHHLGRVAEGHAVGLDIVHIKDPDEGLGANTEHDLARLEELCSKRGTQMSET